MASRTKSTGTGQMASLFDQAQEKGTEKTAQASRRPLLVVLDGHAMVFRAFFALKDRPMTVKHTGQRVEAVYSFASTLFKTIGDLQPTHLAIAFDPPGPTFRHEDFEEYKAHRPEAPPELHVQVELVKQLMGALHVPIYELPGYEADDVIGTIARYSTEHGVDMVIFTGDTDSLQLVSPRVRVLITSGYGDQKLYDEVAVRERYGGLEPPQQRDVKGLQGDTSDNVPGVPGIGAKTAIKLILEFGSIEALYERIDEVTPPRIQQLLRDNEPAARQSKYLVTIVTDTPADFDLETARFGQYTRDEVLEFFRALEFNSLIDRIPPSLREGGLQPRIPALSAATAAPGGEPSIGPPDTVVTIVDNAEALEAMATELRVAKAIVFDTETTSTSAMAAELVGLSFATQAGNAYYVPVGHSEGTQLPLQQVLDVVLPLLHEASIPKVGHNLNFDMTVLAKYGLNATSVNAEFDTMLAAHLLGEKGIGLKALALNKLGVEMTPITALIGTGRKQVTFDAVPIEEAAPYAAADADMTLRLKEALEPELDEKSAKVMSELEMPLVPVVVQMQVNGIALDTAIMGELGRELTEAVQKAEAALYGDVGHHFNVNSPPQLADVLFKELNLPTGRRTQTGYSTDAATLETLRELHPVIHHILEYRALNKLKSTYVDTLPTQVNPRTRRIHTSYNQAGSATGRIASNDPNLQNIPVRTELGRRVRKAFIAEQQPAWELMAADYSQVELRVLAHLAQDPALIAAFERGEDIHASTAALVYKVALGDVTTDMRRLAKVMNFGVIYGLSAFGIAQQTELTQEEGARFIETYFGNYPRVKEYLDETVRTARETGYVETLMGRRRYMPELTSSNHNHRQAAERVAVNMPVQGTAAEIIKVAMIQVQAKLESEAMESRMLLQVHDELVFELPKEEDVKLRGLLEEIMPSALELVVPLEIEIKTGYTWGDMK